VIGSKSAPTGCPLQRAHLQRAVRWYRRKLLPLIVLDGTSECPLRPGTDAWLRCAPSCPSRHECAELHGIQPPRCRQRRMPLTTASHALVLTFREQLQMCACVVMVAITTIAYVNARRKRPSVTDAPFMRFSCSSTLEAKGSDQHRASRPGCAAPAGFLNLLTRYSSQRRPSLVSCW